MTELNKRGPTIIAQNLPPDFTDAQLRELFSPYGTVVSTKILPPNDHFPGAYSFINFQEPESCQEAVKGTNGVKLGRFTLHVLIAPASGKDGKPDVFRNRLNDGIPPTSSDVVPPPSAFNRVNSRQGNSPFQPKATLNSNELDKSNLSKSSSSPAQPIATPSSSFVAIPPHESFDVNESYDVYLSNCQPPNVVFVATLEDHVRATLLLQMMNKIEKTVESKGNSYDSKWAIGQICAALYSQSWYRARVVEVGESRVGVKLLDWGRTHSCDATLETRPLADEFLNDPALCLKCVLDGVPATEKSTKIQSQIINKVLVLDTKLKMTVVRIENNVPHVQLTYHQRNLNQEVRQALSPSVIRAPPLITFEMNQPAIDPFESHAVQITHYNSQLKCFQALLLRDSIVTVINTLKDWSRKKIVAKDQIRPEMLVCAQHNEDDLWYRGWVRSVTDRSCRVYFVDFGNEELIPMDRLSECPDALHTIPWLNVPIQLNSAPADEEEREELWKHLKKYERLTMKLTGQRKGIYNVELSANDKSINEFLTDFRKTKAPPAQPQRPARPQSATPSTISTRAAVQSAATTVSAATNVVQNLTNPVAKVPAEPADNSALNDQMKEMLAEQRKQNKLLEGVLRAINTTNSLLTQLVQRDSNHGD